MIIIYDGSFESFLTLIYEVYYQKLDVKSIQKELPQSLFDDIYEIQFDESKAIKVLDALKQKFIQKHFEMILNIFMCDSVDFEIDLLQYIIMGFKDQKQLNNINHSFVFNLQRLQKELFSLSLY